MTIITIGDRKFPWEDKIKEEYYLRECKETNYGLDPYEQDIKELLKNGLIVIDKPPGPTSHQVVDYVKKILKIKKAGHSGTLDPAVTGVLPIALGKATKVIQALLKAGKEYVCLFKIHKAIPEEEVIKVMTKMVGEITQIPPRRSSVKRLPRKRKVYYLEVLETMDTYYLIRIGVEAGTYIRKWVHDLGKLLGVGAHMLQLRRTRVGALSETNAITLHDLSDGLYFLQEYERVDLLQGKVFPQEEMVKHLPKLYICDSAVYSIAHGASLKIRGISHIQGRFEKGDMVAIMTQKQELVALGEATQNVEDVLKKQYGVVATLERVIIDPSRYPKLI